MTPARLVTRWLLGVLLGTLVIAVTSPLFVRSYLPQRIDPVRGVAVLQSDRAYRWRKEGYATTHIGPLGMPGRAAVPIENSLSQIRIALWGDSQAEGVCVDDTGKLHHQVESIAHTRGLNVVVLPLARSGDDAADWLLQIPNVEKELAIDLHLFLIAELSDLAIAAEPIAAIEPNADVLWQRNFLARNLPAFAIEGVRRFTRDADGSSRRFRFRVGPLGRQTTAETTTITRETDWEAVIRRAQSVTTQPIKIVYAPNIPAIVTTLGKHPTTLVVANDAQQNDFVRLRKQVTGSGLRIIDMREHFIQSADQNRWPHGFHNGQIGNGHLNAMGYSLCAEEIVAMLEPK